MGEDGPAAARTEVIEVTVGRTVEVTREVVHIIAAGDPGQTPLTAIPVGVGVQAEDEGADEVTATGAPTVDPGPTAPPVAVLPGAEVEVAAVGIVEPQVRQVVWLTSAERNTTAGQVCKLYTVADQRPTVQEEKYILCNFSLKYYCMSSLPPGK